MVEVTLTVTIRGNEKEYYVDAKEISDNASTWISGALEDRYDISSWDVDVMPYSTTEAYEKADEYRGHWQDQINLCVELEDRLIAIRNKIDDLAGFFRENGDNWVAARITELKETEK